MKRALAFLLCLVMVFSVLSVGVLAADTLTVNTKSGMRRSIAVGQTFTYSYAIRINGTYDLDRVWLDVLFDDQCLSLDSVEYPTFGTATDTKKPGDLHVEKGAITNKSQYNQGITTIVTCTFRALRAGTTWIRTLPQRIEVESAGDSDHYLVDNYRQYNAARGALFSSFDYLGEAAPSAATSPLSNTKDIVWYYITDSATGEHIGAGQTFQLTGAGADGVSQTYTATTDAYGWLCFGAVSFGNYYLTCTTERADGSAYCIEEPNIAIPQVAKGDLVVRKEIAVRALTVDEMRTITITPVWSGEEIDQNVTYTGDRPTNYYLELAAGGKVYAQGYYSPEETRIVFQHLPIADADGSTLDYELNIGPVEHYRSTPAEDADGFTVDFAYLNDHVWEKVRTEPTCEANGRVTYTCTDCGKVYTYSLSALGHDYAVTGYDATCTEDGYHLYVCNRCNKWYVEDPPAKGHQWTTWSTDIAATDDSDGQRSRTCTVCGAKETRLIHKLSDPDAHVYQTQVVEATCTQGGYTQKVCACGDTIIVDGSRTAPLGHDYTGASATRSVIENSCTEDGLEEYTCSRCGKMHAEVIKAHGHNYQVTEQKEATCTETGYKTTKCAYCGDPRTVRYAALGHDWGEWIVDKPATATENGERHRVCTRCLREDVAVIAATGEGHVHSFTQTEVIAPTCTEQGYTALICPVDGARMIDDTSYVDPLGHDWVEKWRTASTEKTVGTVAYQCSRCALMRYERLPKQEGVWKNPFTDVRKGTWYYDHVEYVAYNEYMTGTLTTKFEPNTIMTRAMLVRVLYNLAGTPSVEGMETPPFTDVKPGWYMNPVIWAYNTGVVAGTGDGTTFSPNDPVTREQTVTIFYRYARYAGYDVSDRAGLSGFADASNISRFALEAFSWAVSAGVISGSTVDGQRVLMPKDTATRAQAATIIHTFDRWRANQ